MPQDMLETLKETDPVLLTEVVRQDQRSPAFELSDWTVERLSDKGIVNPDGLFLFRGHGSDEQGERAWSVALKIVKHPSVEQDSRSMWYWKREVLLMQSGLLERIPDTVVAPRCYRAEEREASGWIWMEHIVPSTDQQWTVDQYAFAARQLGRFNGAYINGTPLPDFAWLAKGHARSWMELFPLNDAWDNPFVSRFCSGQLRERTLRVWDDRERFYDALDRLPQIFSHFDYQRRNLFIRHTQDKRDEIVAVDWAQCGYGALGLDLGLLVGGSALLLELEPSQMAHVEAAAFEAFLAGLSDAGWNGNPERVRLAYTATLLLWLSMIPAGIAIWTSDQNLPYIAQAFGRTPEQCASELAQVCEFALERADETRRLMDRLM